MAVSLAGHLVGQAGNAARVPRRGPAREARHRKVEATPEEVDGADLSQEGRAEALQRSFDSYARLVEAGDRIRVIRPLSVIIGKPLRIRNLVRAAVELRGRTDIRQKLKKARVKLGD